ncbi:MAG: response regulator [Desulfobacterota bacterium]|jgi:DNA-binding response OmpR family regulator|nr:response regulator [Thermodesulfobacteriota bacterium]
MNTEKTRKLVTIVFDPELRALLNDFMSSHDYGVESAEDGLDAFHKLAKNYFDLIITDIRMPGLGGADMVPRLKRIQPWARVIVIPTKKIKRKERQILESAADVCLEKPFKLSQLRTVIQGMFPLAQDTTPSTDQMLNQGRLSWQLG